MMMHELHVRIDDSLYHQLQALGCRSINEVINVALHNYVREQFLNENDEYGIRLQELTQAIVALDDSVRHNTDSVLDTMQGLYALLSDDNSSLLKADDGHA